MKKKTTKTTSAYSIAKRALAIVKKNAPEVKQYSGSINYQPTTSAAMIGYEIPIIPQGVSNNQRIGDTVYLRNLVVRGIILRGAVAISQIRVIIFKGKAEDQKTYTIGTDLLEDVPYVYSIKKQDEKYNTKFLYDKVFTFDSVKTNIINFHFNLKLGWHLHFTEQLNTFRDAGLYIAMVSNQAVAGDAPQLQWNYDVFYTD